jgi:ketosteroid isomerase-like protein
MGTDDIQIVRRVYDALIRWDVDDLLRDLTHDIEWTLPESLPWGGSRHGHEGVRAMLTIFEDHVDGRWADADDYIAAEDRIVVLGRLRGRGRESGVEFEVPFAHVWNVSEGIASRCRSYYDTAPIMAALERSA